MIALLRKIMPLLALATVCVVLYDGWIFYGRWRARREGERQEKQAEAEHAQKSIDMLGGGGLRILNFYASPGEIKRGERANICYGVYGALSVRIEPLTETLHPAVSHCLRVSPAADTSYTLVADDGKGHSAKQTFELRVH
ncbi:MAG: hypothetical protein ABI806_03775 [Candidatus Solibacter sp.]